MAGASAGANSVAAISVGGFFAAEKKIWSELGGAATARHIWPRLRISELRGQSLPNSLTSQVKLWLSRPPGLGRALVIGSEVSVNLASALTKPRQMNNSGPLQGELQRCRQHAETVFHAAAKVNR